MGRRIRGSLTCSLAADGGEKCRTIYICIIFLHAVVVVLVVSGIILIHFLVFVHVCSTGVFCAIHRCYKYYCMRM